MLVCVDMWSMVRLYTYYVLFMKHLKLDVMSKYEHEHVSKYVQALHIHDYTLNQQHNATCQGLLLRRVCTRVCSLCSHH